MTIAEQIDQDLEEEVIYFEGISWRTYISFISDMERSGQHMRVTYDDGRMMIVSPISPKHGKITSLLGRFAEAIADELDIPISTFGAVTWKRKARKKGLEPDECFYIQNEKRMRGKFKIDLRRDPPPDLCIEVDLRRIPLDKLVVYAGIEIPELWHLLGDTIEALVLQPDETYQPSEFSIALPPLRPADLKQFLDLYGQIDQNALMRRVRKWARTLKR